MNSIVLIKEVPDMEKVRFDREKGVVDRSSAEAEINPFDLNALQTAVNLKKEREMTVTAITMGPPGAEGSLRDAYARGADAVILVTDKKFGGSDTWATANTLAAAIKAGPSYDLIICGEKSVDGDTAQVGAEIAELLGIPHAYYVEGINAISDGEIEVTVGNLCGGKQDRKMLLPALISVTKNINFIELPTVKRKLESLKAPVRKLGFAELSGYISEEETGIKGSPTKVVKIRVPKEGARSSKVYKGEYSLFAGDVIEALKARNVI